MLDIAHLFITPALAQDPSVPADAPSPLMSYLPLVLIFAVFYFIVIRPQQKKIAEQEKMIKTLQRGDRIVTSSGIHGKISKIEGDDHFMIEIAPDVHVKLARSHVHSLEAAPKPKSDEKK